VGPSNLIKLWAEEDPEDHQGRIHHSVVAQTLCLILAFASAVSASN
jgi:hypothetical protein